MRKESLLVSSITTGGVHGLNSFIAHVETDIARGMPGFDMVGKISVEVREARERVRVALRNSGITIPAVHITVNIAPADLRKDGTAYDLPVAIGILVCMGFIPQEMTENICMIGELGLNGECKAVNGVLPIVCKAQENGCKICILPEENAMEGAVIPNIRVFGANNLMQVVSFLTGTNQESKQVVTIDHDALLKQAGDSSLDYEKVIGQEACKRAAMIAAAGFHHMLMTGPPGSGKTMIAKNFPSILPPLSIEESLEVSTIYSVSGMLNREHFLITSRPFLNPHHTITNKSLAGGGAIPRPGILSLSHRGVLFLDELPEFSRECIETMRQPLEDKQVQIARSQITFTYPADFILLAASNPCPCGFYPDRARCRCTQREITKYQNKISGPIRDRIDLQVVTRPVALKALNHACKGENSESMRKKVMLARRMQENRFQGSRLRFNADISSAVIAEYCRLDAAESEYMEQIFDTLQLTARSYHKILKVARTIADLEQEQDIRIPHLAEAVSYRVNGPEEEVIE